MGTFIFFGMCGVVIATGSVIVFTTVRHHWFTPKAEEAKTASKNT